MRRYCDLQLSNNPCMYYIAGGCGIVKIGIEKPSACDNYRAWLLRSCEYASQTRRIESAYSKYCSNLSNIHWYSQY
jgi:hypothetical protein